MWHGFWGAARRGAKHICCPHPGLQPCVPASTALQARNYCLAGPELLPFQPETTALRTGRHLRCVLFYCCPLNKHRRCERTQPGVKTPGTSALTKLSPERATEHVTCLKTTCLGLCRPFGASLIVAILPGACAPVCGLSSLRDFRGFRLRLSEAKNAPKGQQAGGRVKIQPITFNHELH